MWTSRPWVSLKIGVGIVRVHTRDKPHLSTTAPATAGQNGNHGSAAWVAAALEASLRARAPGLHDSTPLVRRIAGRVGRMLQLDDDERALLDMSVRVRDVGMVALPDAVVLAQKPLSPDDWGLVNRHPVIGAELLEGLDVAATAAQVVRAHHERWDGGGYPDGLKGDAIPMLSRVIAACDAFVAIASDRPHRRGIGAEAALEQVCQQSGSQFDARVVDALIAALTKTSPPPPAARTGAGTGAQPAATEAAQRPRRRGRIDLVQAIEDLDPLPAFAPGCDRLIAALGADGTTGGELVALIESDTGLTVAILRRAAAVAGRRRITNVGDAVATLSRAEIEETIGGLPRAEFPWRVSQLEVRMHRARVHAQAVARAADRIVNEVQPARRDDVLTVALLHDIGKLLLAHAVPGGDDTSKTAGMTPEARIRHEQRTFQMDHASLGALLLQKWNLPNAIATAVAQHHAAEDEPGVATYVRLADMVAHHAQGDSVDRSRMLALADVCGLSPDALRDVLFDLPHAGGSQRRRAEPSPLSERETAVLRVLSRGEVYKGIAQELNVSTSTVRTHLHNVYAKLGVSDRAQAVLRATEKGWL